MYLKKRLTRKKIFLFLVFKALVSENTILPKNLLTRTKIKNLTPPLIDWIYNKSVSALIITTQHLTLKISKP